MAEPADLEYSVLPTDFPSISAEENLRLAAEEALTALDAAPITGESAIEPPVSFGRGWAFDFGTGQFVRFGQSPARIDEETQLQVWIEKTLYTARYAHPIYSFEYGMEPPLADFVGQANTPGFTSSIATAIKNALIVHDRITDVTDFQFSTEDEYLEVSFTVNLDNGDTLTVPLSLGT